MADLPYLKTISRVFPLLAVAAFLSHSLGYLVFDLHLPTTTRAVTGLNKSAANHHLNTTNQRLKSPKVILRWTESYGRPWKFPWDSHRFENCKYPDCVLTTDRSRLLEANMLLFSDRSPPDFPDTHHPWIVYVHYTNDPPKSQTDRYLDIYKGKVNLTCNYRPEADVYFPYGAFQKKSENISSEFYLPRVLLANRSRDVSWIVSHCVTQSRREKYVDELKKYIPVDVFGKCGQDTIPKDNFSISEGYKAMTSGGYKFYLAFENRFCKDYFSEKPLEPILNDIVPVVLGMANYTRDFPPHTVINALDFASPKHLAQYLLYLTQNETAYYEYFQWRKYYTFYKPNEYCKLCEVLHSDTYLDGRHFVPTFGEDFREWWHEPCEYDVIERLREQQGW